MNRHPTCSFLLPLAMLFAADGHQVVPDPGPCLGPGTVLQEVDVGSHQVSQDHC